MHPLASSPGISTSQVARVVAPILVLSLIATITWAIVGVDGAAAQANGDVVISELFYNPDGSDEGSEFVELFNRSADAIDVSEWTIDGVDGRFGQGATIPGSGYLVVAREANAFSAAFGFAPDEEFAAVLSNGGEIIELIDRNGQVVDTVDYDDQAPWPLAADGDGASLQLLDTNSDNALAESWGEGDPTPGRANDARVGAPAPPVAAMGRGTYTGPVPELLSSSTPGAQIRYTLDGRAPTAQSTLYTGPIQIGPGAHSTATLRAIAIANGRTSMEIAHTYLFVGELADGGFDRLPTVSVQTDDRSNPTCVRAQPTICERERASIDYIDPGGGEGFGVTAAIAVFGDSSVNFQKNSFRLYFDDEWGVSNLDYPVFAGYGQGFIEPADSFDKLELRAQSWDGPEDGTGGPDYYVSDRWWKDTILDLGSLSPHGRFVNVFMNGRYHGVYDLRERFDSKWFESYGEGDSSEYDSVKWDGYFGRVISVNEGTDALFNQIRSASSYAQVKGLIDPVALIHQELVDSLTLSNGVGEREYRLVGGRTVEHPDDAILMHSDNDMAFGLQGAWWTWQPAGPRDHHFGWLWRWRGDPEFRQLIHDETARAFCGDGALTTQASRDRLDFWAAEVGAAMTAEVGRWGANSFTSAIATARGRIESGMPQLKQAWENDGLFVGCDLSPQLAGPDDLVVPSGRAVNVPLGLVDPDGDAFTATATGTPNGLSLSSDGRLTGTTQVAPGDYVVEVRAEDARGRWSLNEVTITVVDGGDAIESPALVLNEYNAVDANAGNWAGQDPAFPDDPTNGGDWFELAIVTDGLDLRGWSVELWDRDRSSETLKQTDTFVFADDPLWSDLRAGSLIAIAESVEQDASYLPRADDWSITVTPTGGLLLGGGSGFDTNRRGFRIAVRDANGNLVGPFMGETEEWRFGQADTPNVSAAEVGALCVPPTADADLVAGMRDVANVSTFAAENTCDGVAQGLADLRPVVGPPGDVDGSGAFDSQDVQAILLYGVQAEPVGVFNERAADVNADGTVDLLDALLAARQLELGG